MCGYINTVNVTDVNLHLCGWVDIVNNHKTVSLRIFLVADLLQPRGRRHQNRSFSLMTG